MTRLLDLKGVTERGVPYGYMHLQRLEKEGKFPKHVKIGHRIAWVETEIDAWIKAKIEARNAA